MNKIYSVLILPLVILLIHPQFIFAQTNLVDNPGFEDITDCDIDWGEVDKATPWKITGSINSSPDVFHECATEDSFYGIPSHKPTYAGDGMAGLVGLISQAKENIYSRLLAPLPTNHDIYLSFAVNPEENFNTQFGIICHSNNLEWLFLTIWWNFLCWHYLLIPF